MSSNTVGRVQHCGTTHTNAYSTRALYPEPKPISFYLVQLEISVRKDRCEGVYTKLKSLMCLNFLVVNFIFFHSRIVYYIVSVCVCAHV